MLINARVEKKSQNNRLSLVIIIGEIYLVIVFFIIIPFLLYLFYRWKYKVLLLLVYYCQSRLFCAFCIVVQLHQQTFQ